MYLGEPKRHIGEEVSWGSRQLESFSLNTVKHTFAGGGKPPALQGETFNLHPTLGGVPELSRLPRPGTRAERGCFTANRHCSSLLHKKGLCFPLGVQAGMQAESLFWLLELNLPSYCNLQESGSSVSCRWHLHPRDGWNLGWSTARALLNAVHRRAIKGALTGSELSFCHSAGQLPTRIAHHSSLAEEGLLQSCCPGFFSTGTLNYFLLNVHTVAHFQVQLEAWGFQPFSIPAKGFCTPSATAEAETIVIAGCAVLTIWKFHLHMACKGKHLSHCLCWAAPRQIRSRLAIAELTLTHQCRKYQSELYTPGAQAQCRRESRVRGAWQLLYWQPHLFVYAILFASWQPPAMLYSLILCWRLLLGSAERLHGWRLLGLKQTHRRGGGGGGGSGRASLWARLSRMVQLPEEGQQQQEVAFAGSIFKTSWGTAVLILIQLDWSASRRAIKPFDTYCPGNKMLISVESLCSLSSGIFLFRSNTLLPPIRGPPVIQTMHV